MFHGLKIQIILKSILGGWSLMKIAPTLFSVPPQVTISLLCDSPVFPYADRKKKRILVSFFPVLPQS